MLLNLAVLFYRRNKGWMALFISKVNGNNIISYLFMYLLFVVPILIAFYLFLINQKGVSPTSAIILLTIVTAVISMPVIYIFLNEIKTIDTDRKKANQRLEMALTAAKLGSYDRDLTTGNMNCTAQCKVNFGLSVDAEFNYPDLLNSVLPEYRDYVHEEINKAVNNQELYQAEYQIQWPDGSKHWISSSGKPQYNADGKAVSIIGINFDITAQNENELRKNTFIGMVSHELKTPLTSLKAYLQVLNSRARKQGDDFGVNALNKAELQVIKMNNMIGGFLNLSRLESGKIVFNKTTFDFKNLVKEVVEETTLTLPIHQITVQSCFSVSLTADWDKIGQVINNIISNAVKYSPNNKSIEVSYSQTGNQLQVSIQDQGMGIEKKDIHKLFDRYYRVETPITRTIAGFGIGLYLSSEIIKGHNGNIWVDSEIGKGSTFWFTLPLSD